MADGRRPRGRALLALSLLLASGLAFSGCADAPRSTGDEAGGADDDDGDEGALGPYAGLVAGVDTVDLPAGDAPASVTGVVYDVTSGEGLDGVLVSVECVVLSLGATDVSRTLVTDEDGAFAMESAPGFAGCSAIAYEVDAQGYRPVAPLESGPLANGVQHVVHAGMVAELP